MLHLPPPVPVTSCCQHCHQIQPLHRYRLGRHRSPYLRVALPSAISSEINNHTAPGAPQAMAIASSKQRSALMVPAELLSTWCNGDQGIHPTGRTLPAPPRVAPERSRSSQEHPSRPQLTPRQSCPRLHTAHTHRAG